MSENNSYLYWLLNIAGIGRKTLMVLSAYAGSPAEIYRLPERDLKWLLNQKQLQKLVESRRKWDIEGEYCQLQAKGIYFYPYGDSGYPEKFLHLPDAPAALYVKGKLPEAACPTIAVIGTRKCSAYGSAMAKQLGRSLAAANIQVISGMARGIDGIGQRAVVETGGSTFAVLGCGVDICYPLENRWLYERITERGGIISEYPPGTQPKASLFPPRNRIISGLSDGVVVVEASEKSGTMITVDMALEQGREVYALPGRLVDGQSSGCNRLIKQGAGVILSMEEFLWELGVDRWSSKPEKMVDITQNNTAPNLPANNNYKAMHKEENKTGDETIKIMPATGTETNRESAVKSLTMPYLSGTIDNSPDISENTARDNTKNTFGNASGNNTNDTPVINIGQLTKDEARVLAGLDYEPRSLAQVADICPDLPTGRLSQILVALCLKGKATQLGAGFYYRTIDSIDHR